MPLGKWPNFDSCVSGVMEEKGFSRARAERYCGAIQHAVEGQAHGKMFVPVAFDQKALEKDGLICGFASTPVVDFGDEKFRDEMPAQIWLEAVPLFFERGQEINLLHRDIPAGITERVEISSKGLWLATRPKYAYVQEMVRLGFLKGFSVEYFYNHEDYDLIPSTNPFDPRPIRRFKHLLLKRVSYVDVPMNPESLFEGAKMNLDGLRYVFDDKSGTLTVFVDDQATFAELARLFSGQLAVTAQVVPDGRAVKAFAFKMAQGPDESGTPRSGPLARFFGTRGDKSAGTDEEDTLDKELQAKYDALATEVEGLSKKMKDLTAVTPEALTALTAQVDGLKAALTPKQGEKALAERIADLEKGDKGADRVTALETGLAEQKALTAQVVAYLEAQKGASTALKPVAPSVPDRW